MPEIKLVGDSNDLSRVHAVMLFPDSEDQAQQFFRIQRIRAEFVDKPDDAMFTVSGGILRLLVAAPAFSDLIRDLTKRTKAGVIAGDLLAALYVMDRFDLNPSMNRAIWAAQSYAKSGAEFADGQRLPQGERQIRKHWLTFSPVAHFWAAVRLNSAYPFTPDRRIFARPKDFERFLAVAAELLRFGTTFIPKGTKPAKPVLDAKRAYTLPAHIQPLALRSERFPERLTELLANYKAPMPYR